MSKPVFSRLQSNGAHSPSCSSQAWKASFATHPIRSPRLLKRALRHSLVPGLRSCSPAQRLEGRDSDRRGHLQRRVGKPWVTARGQGVQPPRGRRSPLRTTLPSRARGSRRAPRSAAPGREPPVDRRVASSGHGAALLAGPATSGQTD